MQRNVDNHRRTAAKDNHAPPTYYIRTATFHLLRTPASMPPIMHPSPHNAPLNGLIETIGQIPRRRRRGLASTPPLPSPSSATSSVSSPPSHSASPGSPSSASTSASAPASPPAHKLEMTDLQFFDAWPMRILLALLAVNLTIVTLRRIPLTLFKLGVWMVHIGILTLIAGSVWYFSQKQEGSVRIFLHQSVASCFDATERRALRVRNGQERSHRRLVKHDDPFADIAHFLRASVRESATSGYHAAPRNAQCD